MDNTLPIVEGILLISGLAVYRRKDKVKEEMRKELAAQGIIRKAYASNLY